MDTSEQYIKMCESAKELQEYWKTLVTNDDDVVVGKHYKSILRWLQKGSMESSPKEDWIWIPRQEQLFEILKGTHSIGAILQGLYWFYEPEYFCPNSDDDYMGCNCSSIGIERRKMFSTIEQFTLAFVMDELYKKRWNDSEWVETKEIDD